MVGACPTVEILGAPVSAVDREMAIACLTARIQAAAGGYVTFPDSYNVVLSREDNVLARAHRNAFMVCPDGTPLTIVGWLRGQAQMRRVSGPDLLLWLCEAGLAHGWRHYFFGGVPGVAEEMVRRLKERLPDLQIAGYESPPFKAASEEPDLEACQRILEAKPDVVWVGLGAPKQEYWACANAPHVPGALLMAVGAAFDFHAGRVQRAPAWMRQSGLEWFHRLISEPRRLWRRYVLFAPRFAVLAALETAGYWFRGRQRR